MQMGVIYVLRAHKTVRVLGKHTCVTLAGRVLATRAPPGAAPNHLQNAGVS